MFDYFDRTHDVERLVSENCLLQLPFEDSKAAGNRAETRRDIDSLDIEVAVRCDEEVTPSASKIEETP